MQKKAFVTCAAIVLANNVIANEDSIELEDDVVLTTIPEGPLGTEVMPGEEVKDK